MPPRRLLAVTFSVFGFLGIAVAWARQAPPAPRALDAQAISLRLLLGVGEQQGQSWNGRVKVDKGEVVGVEGWRFRQDDRVVGVDGWEARSRPALKNAANKKANVNKKAANNTPKKKQAAAKKAAAGNNAPAAAAVANGVFVTVKAPADAVLTVEIERGKFDIPLADLAGGSARSYLDGLVEAQRVPPSAPLVVGPTQDDFPAASVDKAGDVWVAYVRHTPRGPENPGPLRERPKSFADFDAKGGGDQVKLMKVSGGKAGEPMDVTEDGLDVWRPAVAVEGDGSILVVWSEFRDDNWDLYARRLDPARSSWSAPKRLTADLGTDADAQLAVGPDGKVWMAWQGWRDGQADILLAPAADAGSPINVSVDPANDWSPSLAVDGSGRVIVAFDSYRAGNHDVFLRARAADGKLGPVVAVADSAKFEARPSLAVDPRGRAWVAYEERTANWGKDAENLQEGEGTSLYRGSAVKVRAVDGEKVLDAPDPVAQAVGPLRLYNSYPRIVADRSGHVWLEYRHRLEGRGSPVGGTWIGLVATLNGDSWSTSQVLPRSDGMLDNRPALVAPANGPVLAVYDGDGRLGPEGDSVDNDLSVAALTLPSAGAEEAKLSSREPSAPVGLIHPTEREDIARMREHRVQAGGKSYQLLRGEFHRHTEISTDGGNDGSLEDMWRYALDCAHLDWIGNGDHDNGGHKEYTWWLIQKTTDLYHASPAFTPMFTYERSVVYPNGHRNVMFDRRGIRTLPRLNPVQGAGISDDDTKMLYAYLKEFGGITASHTTGTNGMGTDWRDNDPIAEPIVEIFQGHRNSYEHLGAPRVARRPGEAAGGFQPYGMIWNALALQYRLGFQASSDHISTHISYAVAIAEDRTRASIIDAFKKRHCYAATDNILLDVRIGDHLMGDEFDANGPVRLKVMAHGTRPIARVDVIKDFIYVYSTTPGKARVEFDWLDEEKNRPAGLSWYYVRAIQDDGELAWGSPFWVHFR